MPNRSKIKYILPVCVVIVFVAIFIAATVVYFMFNDKRTITFENQLSTSSFEQIANKTATELEVEDDDIGILNDCTLNVESGQIKKMTLHLAVKRADKCEYWEIQNISDGVELIYKDDLEPDTAITVTLKEIAQTFNKAEEIIGNRQYQATFSNVVYAKAENTMGNAYYMDNGEFIKVTESIPGMWHVVNISLENKIGTYVFFY